MPPRRPQRSTAVRPASVRLSALMCQRGGGPRRPISTNGAGSPGRPGAAVTRKTSGVEIPETRYTRSGDLYIAYRVEGEGPFDVVLVPPLAFSIDGREAYEGPFRETVERLTSFARL